MKKLLFLTPLLLIALAFTATAWSMDLKDVKDVKAQATQVAATTTVIKQSDKNTLDGVLEDMTKAPQPVRHIIIAYAADAEKIRPLLTQHLCSASVDFYTFNIISLDGTTARKLRALPNLMLERAGKSMPSPNGFLTESAMIHSHMANMVTFGETLKLCFSDIDFNERLNALAEQKSRQWQDFVTTLPSPVLVAIVQRVYGDITDKEFNRLAILPADASQDQRNALELFKANTHTSPWYIKHAQPLLMIVGGVCILVVAIVIGNSL